MDRMFQSTATPANPVQKFLNKYQEANGSFSIAEGQTVELKLAPNRIIEVTNSGTSGYEYGAKADSVRKTAPTGEKLASALRALLK